MARLIELLRRLWRKQPTRTQWNHGDLVLPHEVLRLYSQRLSEDGAVVIQLYDLPGDRTGARAFPQGTKPADYPPITVCD